MSLQKHAGAVKLFALLIKFSTWLQNIPNKVTPPPFRLVQISSGFWQSRALYVAARLDVATVLGEDRLEIGEIASRVSADPQAVYRLMRMLVSMGIFHEVSPGVFANNRMSACLREGHPENVRSMILMHNSPEMSRPWYERLEQGVCEGVPPFEAVHGMELYEYMNEHREFDALFSRAMDSVDALTGDSFATDFDWGRFDRVIDVGGSKGAKALAILKRHPRLRALVVDRKQVIDEARDYWKGRETPDVLERLGFENGDLLESVPAATSDRDIFLLSAVMHGFDDATCIAGLRNLASAGADSGARVVLMELVMPEMGADLVTASFDMQMFIGTRGRERTLREWRDLAGRSGWVLEETVGLRSFGNLIVLRPA